MGKKEFNRLMEMIMPKEDAKAFTKIIESIEKDYKKEREEFKSAEELGLIQGDLIIFRDGEASIVRDGDARKYKYKNIVEVRRPIEWETIEIKLPKRKRKNKEDK